MPQKDARNALSETLLRAMQSYIDDRYVATIAMLGRKKKEPGQALDSLLREQFLTRLHEHIRMVKMNIMA